MPDQTTQSPAPVAPPAAAALPSIRTPLGPGEVLSALQTASRRGRLPGFTREAGDALFAVEAHGAPFDAQLIGRRRQAEPGSRLVFELRLRRKLPIVFAVVLLATVWPGVYFMDELIAQYLEQWWRPWVTYYWYLPLTILPLPWAWASLMKKSRKSTRESAQAAIQKIAVEVGGTVEG